jgi:hypothetical protein
MADFNDQPNMPKRQQCWRLLTGRYSHIWVDSGMFGFGKEPIDCDIFLRRRPVFDTVQGILFPTLRARTGFVAIEVKSG